VIQLVGKDLTGASGQCGNHGKIGEISGREQQCPRQTHEPGEPMFQFFMGAMVAAHKMRRAGTDAAIPGPVFQRQNCVHV